MLKGELVNLVLCFQSEDLIVGVLAEAGAVKSLLVKFLNVVNGLVDLAVKALVDATLVAQLLSPDVDLVSQDLVLGLEGVQLDGLFLAAVLKHLDLSAVLQVLGGGGTHVFEVALPFSQLFTEFLLLVGQDHKVLLFVLIFLGEAISFALKTLGF